MNYKLGTWDPFHDLGGLQKRLAGMLGGDGGEMLSIKDTDWTPAVDVSEDDETYTISADLPEVSKKDAHVTVKENMLTLSGERKHEQEKKGKKFHRIERSYGKYERTFRIPDNVDPDSITADFKDGVLTILMPKSEVKEAKEQKIKVN